MQATRTHRAVPQSCKGTQGHAASVHTGWCPPELHLGMLWDKLLPRRLPVLCLPTSMEPGDTIVCATALVEASSGASFTCQQKQRMRQLQLRSA